MPSIEKDRIERAARIYASNDAAGSALGIAPGSFGRLCHRYKVLRRRKPASAVGATSGNEMSLG